MNLTELIKKAGLDVSSPLLRTAKHPQVVK